jgi:hypothetical protein
MEQAKTIGNVNILDLRNATEASIAGIKKIGNANVVLYTQQTAGLITRLNVDNLNITMQVPQGVTLQKSMGPLVINRDYFKGQQTPSYLLVFGPATVEPDVPSADIEKLLSGMAVMGPLICAESLAGLVHPKANVLGPMITYPTYGKVKIGSLTLDQSYLEAMADGSDLAVVGGLLLPAVLPNDVLERKLGKLYVTGDIKCHEENARTIKAHLTNRTEQFTIIPAGFALVEKPLTLDSAMLESLPARKLYCSEWVVVTADVSSNALDERLEAIVSRQLVLCPAGLRPVLARKCNLLETRVVFYEGELVLIDDNRRLQAARLNYLKDKATLVVFGELTLDPTVTPQVLLDRFTKVHNLGRIRATPEQIGALEARLGLHEGELQDSTRAEEDEAETTDIGNINYLEL